jgi:hypothetical protein
VVAKNTPFKIDPDSYAIVSGSQIITLTLRATAQLSPGEHLAAIEIQTRDGLLVEPDENISLNIQVQPMLTRCQSELMRTGLSIVLLSLVLVVSGKKIKKRRTPPQVTGILRVWPTGKPHLAQEIDLTALQKAEISLGSSPEADCILTGQDIAPFHLQIQALRAPNETRIQLSPLAAIKINYLAVEAPFALKHRDTFQVGDRSIQYLSDAGF